MKKMHVYVPKGVYTCTYMVLPFSFETLLLLSIISKKSNTETAWLSNVLGFIFSKYTIIYNGVFLVIITDIFNKGFNND